MPHKSYAQLAMELAAATEVIEISGLYRHYKDLASSYKITGLTILESSDELAVLYSPQDQPRISFCRPLTSWLEKVEVDGVFIERFQRIEANE